MANAFPVPWTPPIGCGGFNAAAPRFGKPAPNPSLVTTGVPTATRQGVAANAGGSSSNPSQYWSS